MLKHAWSALLSCTRVPQQSPAHHSRMRSDVDARNPKARKYMGDAMTAVCAAPVAHGRG